MNVSWHKNSVRIYVAKSLYLSTDWTREESDILQRADKLIELGCLSADCRQLQRLSSQPRRTGKDPSWIWKIAQGLVSVWENQCDRCWMWSEQPSKIDLSVSWLAPMTLTSVLCLFSDQSCTCSHECIQCPGKPCHPVKGYIWVSSG